MILTLVNHLRQVDAHIKEFDVEIHRFVFLDPVKGDTLLSMKIRETNGKGHESIEHELIPSDDVVPSNDGTYDNKYHQHSFIRIHLKSWWTMIGENENGEVENILSFARKHLPEMVKHQSINVFYDDYEIKC